MIIQKAASLVNSTHPDGKGSSARTHLEIRREKRQRMDFYAESLGTERRKGGNISISICS